MSGAAWVEARATPLLAGLAACSGPGRPVRGRGQLLAGRGRRRLHGPVGGAAGQAGRSRPRRRGAGGGDGGRGRQRPQRRVHRRVPDPWPAQRPQPVPRRDRPAGAAGAREPGRHRAGDRAPRHRLRLGADGVDPGRPQPARGRGAERVRAGDAGARLRLRLARPRGGARAGRLAHLPGRHLGAERLRAGRPGPPGMGASPRLHRAGRAAARAVAGDGAARAGRRRDAVDAGWPAAGRARRAGHQRLPAVDRRHPPLHRPRVRLRAGDRAAVGAADVGARLERPAGPVRRRQPVPLLPADRRQPHPVGWLRRRIPLRQRRRSRAGTAAGHLHAACRATSSRPSRSWRAFASRTAGAG